MIHVSKFLQSLLKGRDEKINLVLFHVFPWIAGIQCFMALRRIDWTPVSTCLREAASAKAGRGDEYIVIFLYLPLSNGGKGG